MSSAGQSFRLDETVAGHLRELCNRYHIDGSWLSWKYETHCLVNGASPFRITTNAYGVPLEEGVPKVTFTIEFDHANPNLVKWLRFEESPTKKTFLITQTSMKHVGDGGSCPIWLELPKGAGSKEDISAVQSLVKIELCCPEWRSFLPPDPETALERAQLTMARDDIDWMRIQLGLKDRVTQHLYAAMKSQEDETMKLRAEVAKLQEDEGVAKTTVREKETEDLKREPKAEAKKKDKTVGDVEKKLKAAQAKIEKLEATIKEAMEQEKPSEAGCEPPSAGPNKKRKTAALDTPTKTAKPAAKSKKRVLETPKTAPALSTHAPLFPGIPVRPNSPFTTAGATGQWETRGGGVPTDSIRLGDPASAPGSEQSTPSRMPYHTRGSDCLAMPLNSEQDTRGWLPYNTYRGYVASNAGVGGRPGYPIYVYSSGSGGDGDDVFGGEGDVDTK